MSYDYEILKENSDKYSKLIELLVIHDEQFIHVPHMAHLAVELAGKSFLSRNGVSFNENHDLNDLFQKSFNLFPKGLLGVLQRNGNEGIYDAYKEIKLVWNMNDRYRKWKFKQSTVSSHYVAYKKVISWLNKI